MEKIVHYKGEAVTPTTTALQRAEEGYSCAEAILIAFGVCFGIDEKMAMKIASGFGGGMGLMGETCGSVTAAFMVIGLMFGPESVSDTFARENTYEQVSEFATKFLKRRGSLLCRDLCAVHGLELSVQARALRESGLPLVMIRTAGEILEEMLPK